MWEDHDPDPIGFVISFDSIGNDYQKRHELPRTFPSMTEALNFYNGKFYGLEFGLGWIFEYDPSTDQSAIVGRLEGGNWTPEVCDMTLKDGVFYGVSSAKPLDQEARSYLFTWDPATHILTKRNALNGATPSGRMVEKDGKLYGMVFESKGTGNMGYIFEWNPVTYDFVKKINFTEEDKAYSTGSMILFGGKFYGLCSGSSDFAFYGAFPEDPLLTGCLFEWDPATNAFTVKYDFDVPEDGVTPGGSMVEMNGKLYGIAYGGGYNNHGVLFEFDPATNAYTKKANLSDINVWGGTSLAVSAGNIYGYSNGFLFEWNASTGVLSKKQALPSVISDLLVVPAPISTPTPGSCESYPAVQVDQANNNQWVALTDSKGDVLAELQPHGNNLGLVNAQSYINNTAIRTDGAGRPYLDRSITIIPSAQPAEGNPVDIRLYITKSEFDLLKSAPNSGITGIADIGIFKSNDPCSAVLGNATPIPTTYEDYEFGYVLKATVTSFSTFYFSNRAFGVLPLELLAFTGISKDDDVILQWTTEHEYNTRDIDIEKSTDGIHFSTAGNIAALNSPGKHEYSFTDYDAGATASGKLYYRLKQKDLNGKYEYSKTIIVYMRAIRSLTISPNPAQNFLDIVYREQNVTQKLRLQITDLSGKKVLEQIIDPAAIKHRINITALSKGVYFISILNNGKRTTARFAKQ